MTGHDGYDEDHDALCAAITGQMRDRQRYPVDIHTDRTADTVPLRVVRPSRWRAVRRVLAPLVMAALVGTAVGGVVSALLVWWAR